MAPDVIDLISSSPPVDPPPSAQPLAEAQDCGNHAGRSDAANRGQSKTVDSATTKSAPRIDDFLFLSDDFDTTIDLDEPISTGATSNKRRCLSPLKDGNRHHKRISPASPLKNTRPSVQTSRPPRRTSAFDPIEFTSSPDPILTKSRRQTSRNATSAPDPSSKPTNQTIGIRHDDSDPFASSPQIPDRSEPLPGRSEPLPAKSMHIESSDPFASSSPVKQPKRISATSTRPALSIDRGIIAPKAVSPKRHREWDPISSSAPEQCPFASSPPTHKQRNGTAQPMVIDIVDSDLDTGAESDDSLPDISTFDVSKIRSKPRSLQRSQSDIVTSRSRSSLTKRVTKQSAGDKSREREARAAAKEAEKESKRLEKQEAKEAKLREKERAAALAQVNKVRTDKKVSTPEMIVDMPSSLNPTVTAQLETLLKEVGVQYTKWDSPVDNVVKWRRKVTSLFNDDLGLWEPTYLRIEDEKHALVFLTAEEFVQLVLSDELEAHVTKMELHFRRHHLIYLLEGLTPWLRKNRNIRNRQFASGVRAQESATGQAQSRRRNAPQQEYIPEETIEDALLQLQVMHDVLIHHTTIPLETAQWITIFTQHVSTIPYRQQRDRATLGAAFCMESGQVKTGEDTQDTYVRMLQEIVRVTAPIAYGIASEFDTVSKLVSGLEKDGPTRLEGVRKCANKDGAFTERNVGQAVSRRMYKVFTGRDESSTDV